MEELVLQKEKEKKEKKIKGGVNRETSGFD